MTSRSLSYTESENERIFSTMSTFISSTQKVSSGYTTLTLRVLLSMHFALMKVLASRILKARDSNSLNPTFTPSSEGGYLPELRTLTGLRTSSPRSTYSIRVERSDAMSLTSVIITSSGQGSIFTMSDLDRVRSKKWWKRSHPWSFSFRRRTTWRCRNWYIQTSRWCYRRRRWLLTKRSRISSSLPWKKATSSPRTQPPPE